MNETEKQAVDLWNDFVDNCEQKLEGEEAPAKIFEDELWSSLALGFLMGKGVSPSRSFQIVRVEHAVKL